MPPTEMIFSLTMLAIFVVAMVWVFVQEWRAWCAQDTAQQQGYDDALNWRPFNDRWPDATWRDYRYGFRLGCHERQRVTTVTPPDYAKPAAYVSNDNVWN